MERLLSIGPHYTLVASCFCLFHTSVKRVVVSQELEAAKVLYNIGFSLLFGEKTVFVWLRLHGWRVPPCPFSLPLFLFLFV